ncbi:MAG: NADH:flavin oxidoreductase/NADH oxidase [Pseudomonadota bacterium]
MTSALFEPIQLRGLTLRNRIVISPMCQYSATEGSATDWHLIHLGGLSLSGAGILILEATAVAPQGRITPGCLGLWNDDNEDALRRVLKVVRRHSRIPIGIQLSHAGRKAAAHPPFVGRGPLLENEGAWPVVGPSAVAFGSKWQTPRAMTLEDMVQTQEQFVQAVQRAQRLGLDLIEVHAAHGYLLSAFLSPLANRREDEYGGSLDNRMRFPLRVFEAMRQAWPAEKPLGVRINGTDWHEAGITPHEAAEFAAELAARRCDFIDVSSGGNVLANVPLGPGYQVPLAQVVRERCGLPTIAVGLISEPHQAEAIVSEGRADMVAIARAALNNPHWPWQAAEVLGANVEVPLQYYRAATRAGVPPPYHVEARS